MKTNFAQFLVSYVCPHCSDLHRQILTARDMSDAFKKTLDGGAVSFDIIANPENEPQPTSPTLFYEEDGKIHAHVFFPSTPVTEIKTFSESCQKTRKFRGLITAHQAIFTRHGD